MTVAVSQPKCRRCGGPKPSGHGRSYCVKCSVIRRREAAKTYRDSDRGAAAKLRKRLKAYNLTEDEYYKLLDRQDGKCAVCGQIPDVFHIDHDHRCCPAGESCGRCVRGLLCSRCNQGIGFLQDDFRVAYSAYAYLVLNDKDSAEFYSMMSNGELEGIS